MKKIILIIGIIMAFVLVYNGEEDYILIPNEAIRVRVIANSDMKNDIDIKEEVKDDLNNELNFLLKNVKKIDDARKILNNNLDVINKTVDKSLKRLNYDKQFNINYGMNYFPEKEFKGVKYPEGYYESLVVTLGDGEGSNYWCVLYPPLCLLETDEKEDIVYKSYVIELFEKYS